MSRVGFTHELSSYQVCACVVASEWCDTWMALCGCFNIKGVQFTCMATCLACKTACVPIINNLLLALCIVSTNKIIVHTNCKQVVS